MQVNSNLDTNTYDLSSAMSFYTDFIYNTKLQGLLHEHGFHIAGSVPSVSWELFASILTGDNGKQGYGADLENHEVKSAIQGGSFEYQYHLNGGKKKLEDDMIVNHLYISYSNDYSQIEVRLLEGIQLSDTFKAWMPGLIENYKEGPNRKQRYRKSISFGFVNTNGRLILKTENGNLVQNNR